MKNPSFNRMLARRGMDTRKLADLLFVAWKPLLQVLGGKRKGGVTWGKLRKVLTVAEYECAWNFAQAILKGAESSGSAEIKRRVEQGAL